MNHFYSTPTANATHGATTGSDMNINKAALSLANSTNNFYAKINDEAYQLNANPGHLFNSSMSSAQYLSRQQLNLSELDHHLSNNHHIHHHQYQAPSFPLPKHNSFPLPGQHHRSESDYLSASSAEHFNYANTHSYNTLNNSLNSESSDSPTSSSSIEPLQLSPRNHKYIKEFMLKKPQQQQMSPLDVQQQQQQQNNMLMSKEVFNFNEQHSNYLNGSGSHNASMNGAVDSKMYESQLSQANKRPKSTFPFGKCKVCTDKATGIHYGIATCEGCKV